MAAAPAPSPPSSSAGVPGRPPGQFHFPPAASLASAAAAGGDGKGVLDQIARQESLIKKARSEAFNGRNDPDIAYKTYAPAMQEPMKAIFKLLRELPDDAKKQEISSRVDEYLEELERLKDSSRAHRGRFAIIAHQQSLSLIDC